jgi:hypothetical protein
MAALIDTNLEGAGCRSRRGRRGGSRPALIAALVLVAAGLAWTGLRSAGVSLPAGVAGVLGLDGPAHPAHLVGTWRLRDASNPEQERSRPDLREKARQRLVSQPVTMTLGKEGELVMTAGKNRLIGSWITEGGQLHLSTLPPVGAAPAVAGAPAQQGTYPYRLDANRLRLARDGLELVWTRE